MNGIKRMEVYDDRSSLSPYYVVAGTIGVTATILFGVREALRNAGWVVYERAVAVRVAAITIIGWFVVTTGLAFE